MLGFVFHEISLSTVKPVVKPSSFRYDEFIICQE